MPVTAGTPLPRNNRHHPKTLDAITQAEHHNLHNPTTMYLTAALIHALPFSDRRVCNRDEAASYVGVSPGKFDKMVGAGLMPSPLRYGSVRRWDKKALDRAIAALAEDLGAFPDELRHTVALELAGSNEWDEVMIDGQERPAAKRY
jgi:hypothetical protein